MVAPQHRRGLVVKLLLALALAATLAACGKNEATQLEALRQLMARNEIKAATVSAKALIQTRPHLAEPRWLLASLLLDSGEPGLAEIELMRALELGAPEARVLPLLGRTLVAGGHMRKLLAQYGALELPEPQANAELKTSVAQAHAATGDLAAAGVALNQALTQAPDYEPAQLLQVRLRVAADDLPGAMALVDKMLQNRPSDAEAWVLKGDLSARNPATMDQAMAAWRQALQHKPDHVRAHAALVSAQLALRQVDGAKAQFALMKQALPNHPHTRLFEGQLAFLAGDLEKSRGLFQQLLRGAPNNLVLLQSAGAVELRLNAPAMAERLLAKALLLAPEVAPTRRLLAQSYVALGQADRALAALEPLLQPASTDVEALTLAAQAELLGGNARAAEAIFNRVAKLKPDDPSVRTALALTHLSRGQADKTIAELQSVAAMDKGITADLALVSTHMRARSYDAALKAVMALEAKQADKPMPAYLRGQVLLARKDLAGARQAFEQALIRQDTYLPAVNALAGLDLSQDRPEAAKARFEALVKADPRNATARLGLAELARRGGADRDAVAKLMEAAVKANPDSLAVRLALVDHHLATFNAKAAMIAAQAALAQLPEDLDLLFRLGRAQLIAGEQQQAISSFGRVVALQPRSEQGYLGLAEAQIANKELPAAARSVQRALELAPKSLAAHRQGIAVAMLQKQSALALSLARQVQALRPDDGLGFVYEGEIEIAAKRWDAALAVLRKAVARPMPGQAPTRLHQALLGVGQTAEAAQFAQTWTRDHPQDTLFHFYLGDLALHRKDLPAAQQHYEAVLQVQPEQALALNNLAWLRLEQKLPGALALAERAVKAAPDRPALLDTLALVHAAEGRADQALAVQRRAVLLQPGDPALRLNLARFLIQAGEKREAKAELDRLDILGDRFAGQTEVQSMLGGLGRR